MEIPLDIQIKDLFSRPGFYENVQYRFNRRKHVETNIEDIYDGMLYKEYFKQDGFLQDRNNISFMWYTDGVPLFKSSKFSIWPLCFTINELSYNQRTQTENLILAGLWFGENKPNMLTFMKPFTESLLDIKKNGVEVNIPNRDSPVVVHAMLIGGTCDLPAKCMVLNMNQFNGRYGCAKCLQQGKSVPSGKGSVWIFPFDKENIDGPYRNHVDTIEHGMQAIERNEQTFGIKGASWIANAQADIIRGTAIDYMHTVLLGVVRKLLKLWFDSKYSKEEFSLSKHLKVIDKRLLRIKPPSFISRVPRSIAQHSKYWKASECRSWLFFYSLPVLADIMDTEYLTHYQLLVDALYILNSESVSSQQNDQCKKMLTHFVFMYGVFYGERHMSANIHQLLHLADVVKDLGPLWVYSCFPLEDFNGRLLKLFHGTQKPHQQIIESIGVIMRLPEVNVKFNNDPIVSPLLLKLSKKAFEKKGLVTSGILSKKEMNLEQMKALQKAFGRQPLLFSIYSRVSRGIQHFYSAKYGRVQCRNSYTVLSKVNNKSVVLQIDMFVKCYTCSCTSDDHDITECPSKLFVLARKLELADKQASTIQFLSKNDYRGSSSHLSLVLATNNLVAMELDFICEILVCIEIDDKLFVSRPPNKCEKD